MKKFVTMLLFCTLCASGFIQCLAEGGFVFPDSMPEIKKMPIDLSGGMPAQPNNFLLTDDSWSYADPSISVRVSVGRLNNCDWWKADIIIADASQLRSAAAGGFDSSMVTSGEALAKRVRAILAIDGDYYWQQPNGFVLRQGRLYVNNLDGTRDALVIDEDGDFHILHKAQQSDVTETINGKRAINGWCFGPVLVENGERLEVHGTGDMVPYKPRQRMAICQAGPLHYVAICCGPPARGSVGMTLQQFADLVYAQGVQTAYNLDGGDSCMMIFNGKKINDVLSWSTRNVSDIIYFASSYVNYGAN